MQTQGCTTCLCPEEVAMRNRVKVEDHDPDEPPCRDTQGNMLNIVGQAELEFSIKGFKTWKKA